jgi:flagellar biosynthetic protein FlhB
MPDEGFQEKSERATPRKRQQARKKGQVARSRDLTSMAAMGGFILIFYFGGEYFFLKLSDLTGGILSLQYGMNPLDISKTAILQTGQILAPFFITSIVLVIAASVMQGGFVIKPHC